MGTRLHETISCSTAVIFSKPIRASLAVSEYAIAQAPSKKLCKKLDVDYTFLRKKLYSTVS